MNKQSHIHKKADSSASNPVRSQLQSRPKITQAQPQSDKPLLQTQTENQEFQQQKFEATKLELQAKYGTITPEGQEQLTVLQAKMSGSLHRRLQQASSNSSNFANIPRSRPNTPLQQAVQTKLKIGKPGDKYEQEADRVASQVVNQINAPVSQQLSQNLQQKEMFVEEKELQMKPMLQLRSAKVGMTAVPEVEASIKQARGGGQPLAKSIRKPMEQAIGANFGKVRVHTDNRANQLNQSIQAKAFTTGQDVFFRNGAYAPGSKGGQELIAHELTHVVQQNGGQNQRMTQQPGTGQLVQRYTTERTIDKELYNVSQNRRFLVGIKYPNHDLFVHNEDDVTTMNEIVQDGMIEFTTQGSQEKKFGTAEAQTYHKVYPKYKDAIQTSVPVKGHERELKENRKAEQEKMKPRPLEKKKDVKPILIQMSNQCESIRKLIVQTDYNETKYEQEIQPSLASIKTDFIKFYKELNAYLNGENIKAEQVRETLHTFMNNLMKVIINKAEIQTGTETEESSQELHEILTEELELAKQLSNHLEVNLDIRANSLLRAHEADQKETLLRGANQDNLLLPAGCDLMATTILGKQQELKITDSTKWPLQFKEGPDITAHHYTKPLITDETDYVSLEGFAIKGVQVHDNRWEYFLHGNRATQENAFLDYTKRRYEFQGKDTRNSSVVKQRVGGMEEPIPMGLRNRLNKYQKE